MTSAACTTTGRSRGNRRFGWMVFWATVLGMSAWVGPTVTAQEAEEKPDPVIEALHGRVGQFFQAVALTTPQAAYQELLAGSPLLKQTEALAALVEQTGKLKDRCGEYRGLERLSAKHLGTDLVVMVYLYKCENYPVLWRFVFYRTPARAETPPGNTPWLVISVRFDTELDRCEY